MTNEFRKVLDLIKRTGDKLVFYDAENDSSFIILPLAEYEKLVVHQAEIQGLTEQQLLDKINRDIALWRAEQKLEKLGEAEEEMVEELNHEPVKEPVKPAENPAEDVYHFEPAEEE